MSKLLEQAKAAAAKLDDQTEEKGGFTYEPPAKGPCIGRLVSYIELGNFPQEYNGQPKAPAREMIVEFELLGKKHAKEIEITNEDGSKTKKVVYPIIRERLPIKHSSRAASFKMLKALDYGRGNTNIAFMLGEAFIINIIHKEADKDGKKVVYANIKDDTGNWTISAPVRVNEEGETEPLNAPKATVEERLLLWDAPSKEMWDSIYIGGTRTKKVDGKETEVSKNWIQAECRSALDFEGSPLATLLAEIGGDLPDMSDATDALGGATEDDLSDEDLGVGNGANGAERGAPGEDEDPLADLEL